MEEPKKDVKPEGTTPTPVQEKTEETTVETTEVSEDVKTPEVETEETVDKSVYENVRDAMRKEREEKKAVKGENEELLKRIESLENTQETEDIEDIQRDQQRDPRVDIIYEMNRDPFVKDNLDLIEARMTDNPTMNVSDATLSIKAELFDRIQKETPAPTNKPLKQEKPTATGEAQTKVELSDDPSANLKKALKGELDIDPAQLEAIKRALPPQK